MKAVLFASRAAPELLPLTSNHGCAALLPVAGKPLVVHAVESLAMASLKEAIVVVSPAANEVRKTLGDGARWGMHFEYLPARGAEAPDNVLRRLNLAIGEQFLVVRGEMLRSPMIAEFMARAASVDALTIAAFIRGVPAGIRLVRQGARHPLGLPDEPGDRDGWREFAPALEFPTAGVSLIESLVAFHQANLKAISGEIPGLLVPGRRFVRGVMVGRNTRLPATAIKGTSIFVGSRCDVASDAELMSEVVVSDNVVIDRHATLRSAVIMPDSYIGQLVEVSGAIVNGSTLIDIDTGAVTRVTDSFLLTSVFGNSVSSRLRKFVAHGSVAALLTILLPLRWLAQRAKFPSKAADRFAGIKSTHGRYAKANGAKQEGPTNDLEGDHIGGRVGYATLPDNPRGVEAARTDLRQTDDLLSVGSNHDGRDP